MTSPPLPLPPSPHRRLSRLPEARAALDDGGGGARPPGMSEGTAVGWHAAVLARLDPEPPQLDPRFSVPDLTPGAAAAAFPMWGGPHAAVLARLRPGAPAAGSWAIARCGGGGFPHAGVARVFIVGFRQQLHGVHGKGGEAAGMGEDDEQADLGRGGWRGPRTRVCGDREERAWERRGGAQVHRRCTLEPCGGVQQGCWRRHVKDAALRDLEAIW
ncbi:hypothetical protein SETIT_8G155400v2 [Setaria italica]|uniref:Uncharacterized protein n=1 Tax=Setaria italica TaxID=4555 RepID=A0A368S847_SETIT|nr:hypothetical protein SETIT_8G155400v2 [Setaria italica]